MYFVSFVVRIRRLYLVVGSYKLQTTSYLLHTKIYLSLTLSSLYRNNGLKKNSINLLFPVFTSTVTAMPGVRFTSLSPTCITLFFISTRAAYTSPRFSSATDQVARTRDLRRSVDWYAGTASGRMCKKAIQRSHKMGEQ